MKYLFYLLPLAFIISCAAAGASSGTESRESNGDVLVVDPPDGRNITDYLRTVAGVSVSGDGPSAQVTIRGQNSINMSQEPLFVIDGAQISGGLASVYGAVTVADIDYIKVLKDASDVAIYGLRGSNGVIEIYTKQ